jgi:hypothetical protein
MATTDYDAPRRTAGSEPTDDLDAIPKARRDDTRSGQVDVDDTELNQQLDVSGQYFSDLSMDELSVPVIPLQDDEFTCTRCFLVHHHTRLAARGRAGRAVCRDCR